MDKRVTYESPVMEYISETLNCVLCASGTGTEVFEEKDLNGSY